MIKDVLVTVRGQQRTREEEGEVIELVVPGKYHFRDGEHYIMYEEVADQSREITKNLVKFTENRMELRKKGYLNSLMIFEKGKRTFSKYHTPFGSFDTGITTLSLQVKESEKSIAVEVKYAMTLDEDFVQDSQVTVCAAWK